MLQTTSAQFSSNKVNLKQLIGNVEGCIEELQHSFLRQIYRVDLKAIFPRVFSLWWSTQNVSSNSQLRFLCEFPGEWHFEGNRTFDISAKSITEVVTYLYPLAEVTDK